MHSTSQDGTSGRDELHGAAAGSDGSFIVAGLTDGDWDIPNLGGFDFAAMKLDSDLEELWRWQVRWPLLLSSFTAVVAFVVERGVFLGGWQPRR